MQSAISIIKKHKALGATLVEYALIVGLIAVVALPAVKKYGVVNACQYCKYRYCLKYGDWPPDCDATGDVAYWKGECVDHYVDYGWRDWCEAPDVWF